MITIAVTSRVRSSDTSLNIKGEKSSEMKVRLWKNTAASNVFPKYVWLAGFSQADERKHQVYTIGIVHLVIQFSPYMNQMYHSTNQSSEGLLYIYQPRHIILCTIHIYFIQYEIALYRNTLKPLSFHLVLSIGFMLSRSGVWMPWCNKFSSRINFCAKNLYQAFLKLNCCNLIFALLHKSQCFSSS